MPSLLCLVSGCCLCNVQASVSRADLVRPFVRVSWSLCTVRALLFRVEPLLCESALYRDRSLDNQMSLGKGLLWFTVSEIQATASWPRACDSTVPHSQSVGAGGSRDLLIMLSLLGQRLNSQPYFLLYFPVSVWTGNFSIYDFRRCSRSRLQPFITSSLSAHTRLTMPDKPHRR